MTSQTPQEPTRSMTENGHELSPSEDRASLNPRQARLLDMVRARGYATIEALSRHFDVSTQTIRRDIILLDEAGLLQRFHGGAGVADTTVRLGYAEKQRVSADGKDQIGAAVARMTPDGASVMLDVGTTVEATARALRARNGLRVFTCSLNAALILSGLPGVEVVVVGGLVRGPDGSIVGDAARKALSEFRVDLAIIGVSGFDGDGAPMDFDLMKVSMKQAMIENSRRALIVADRTKFEREAIMRVAPASAFDAIVTDGAPPARLRDRFDAAGVAIVRADLEDASTLPPPGGHGNVAS